MPLLTVKTNISAKDDKEVLDLLTESVAKLTGKPKGYVSVIIEDEKKMAFGGTLEPCAMIQLGTMENGPSSSPKVSQGKRGSESSGSLSQFMGKSWTTWQNYTSAVEAKGPKKEEEETATPMPRGSSMKLRREDMALFGLCPSQDEFYLVVCEHCDIVIKPQALRGHIEAKHPNSLEHRWTDSPTPVATGTSTGVPGDGVEKNRLSANPSPTPAGGSTSSSSASAGGPSSRSTPSPSRSSGSSRKNKEKKSGKNPGKRGGKKAQAQAQALVLVNRLPSPLPKTVVVPGPRDEEEAAVPEVGATTSSSASSSSAAAPTASGGGTGSATPKSSSITVKEGTSESPTLVKDTQKTTLSTNYHRVKSSPSSRNEHREIRGTIGDRETSASIEKSATTTTTPTAVSSRRTHPSSSAKEDLSKSLNDRSSSATSPLTNFKPKLSNTVTPSAASPSSSTSSRWIKSHLPPPPPLPVASLATTSSGFTSMSSSSSSKPPVQTLPSSLSEPVRLDSPPTRYSPGGMSPLPQPSSPSSFPSRPSSPSQPSPNRGSSSSSPVPAPRCPSSSSETLPPQRPTPPTASPNRNSTITMKAATPTSFPKLSSAMAVTSTADFEIVNVAAPNAAATISAVSGELRNLGIEGVSPSSRRSGENNGNDVVNFDIERASSRTPSSTPTTTPPPSSPASFASTMIPSMSSSKSRNTFLPVNNEVIRNNPSVAMTLARMSGDVKGDGGNYGNVASFSSPTAHAPPLSSSSSLLRSRSLTASPSPEKRTSFVSPANLIDTVRRKENEAKSKLYSNVDYHAFSSSSSAPRWSPSKQLTSISIQTTTPGQLMMVGTHPSFAPMLEEPFANNSALTSTFEHQQRFSPSTLPRHDLAGSSLNVAIHGIGVPLAVGIESHSVTGSVRETDVDLQNIMDELNPGSLMVSPTDVLQSQTPHQQPAQQQFQQFQQHQFDSASTLTSETQLYGGGGVRFPSTSSSEDVAEFLDPNHAGVSHQRNHFFSPPPPTTTTTHDVADIAKKKSGAKGSGSKVVLCKDRTYDPDRHCGVSDDGNKFTPCTRSLTCKSHNLSARRSVGGRSKAFDILLQEHKKAKDAKMPPFSASSSLSSSSNKLSPLPTTMVMSSTSPSATSFLAVQSFNSSSSNTCFASNAPSSFSSTSATTFPSVTTNISPRVSSATIAFEQPPSSTSSSLVLPSTVVHYPGGSRGLSSSIASSSSCGNFRVPSPVPTSTSSSLLSLSSSPFNSTNKRPLSRVSLVRTPFAPPPPLPRSFETPTIPCGSPNRNHVTTVPRPRYLPLSESETTSSDHVDGAGGHVRGLCVPKGPWPTSSQPPQAIAMCSFGARATPSALPTSCSSGSCMLLGRRLDLFRSAFKAAVDSHLNPPPSKKTCASASTSSNSLLNESTSAVTLDPLSAAVGYGGSFASQQPGVVIPANPLSTSSLKPQQPLLNQLQVQQLQQSSKIQNVVVGGKADVNANLNGALGVRFGGASSLSGLGVPSGSTVAPTNSVTLDASLLNSTTSAAPTSATSLMSPPSRQLYSSNSSLSKSSPTSAVKRKRSSGSFAPKSDDSDSSCSSATATGIVVAGGSVIGANDQALPSSSSSPLQQQLTGGIGAKQQLESHPNHLLQQKQQQHQQQLRQLQLQQGNTQTALAQKRLSSGGVVSANSISISSLPLTVQSQVLTTGGIVNSAPAFRQLTEMQQQQLQQQRQAASLNPSSSVAPLEQVIMSPPGQFHTSPGQGQSSIGSRIPATSGTIYLSSGSGINVSPVQHQQQQQVRLSRSTANLTSVTRHGMISGGHQVVVTAAAPLIRPPSKLDHQTALPVTNAINRTLKNMPQNRPALAGGRALSSTSTGARRFGLGCTPLSSSSSAVSSGAATTSPSQTSAVHLRGPAHQDFLQQSLPTNSSLSSQDVTMNPNDNAGLARLSAAATASQQLPPPQFGTPNSSSHHKDARVSSVSPLRGLVSSSSSVPSSPSSSQVLSASMTQSLHLPNGLRTLPAGHPGRAALMAGDRTRGSVTVVGTTAGVLGLTNPAAKGQETVTAATHLLASSGSHVASKHLSSSS